MRVPALKLFLFFSFLIIHATAYAEVFTVTNNADTGVGTLRQALSDAAANGILEQDYINFALPGSAELDRTILLKSELPFLSGHLVIDGTTQPGPGLGISDAKVILKADRIMYQASAYSYGCLNLISITDVEIYGLAIDQFFSIRVKINPNGQASWANAINVLSSSGIVIGAPNKGNVFMENDYGIRLGKDEIYPNGSAKAKIQSNWFGLNFDGSESTQNNRTYHLAASADLLEIGGPDASYGNIMGGYAAWGVNISGLNVKVRFNRFGFNANEGKASRVVSMELYLTNGEFTDNDALRFDMRLNGNGIKFMRNKEHGSEYLNGTIYMPTIQNVQFGSDDLADANEFQSRYEGALGMPGGQNIEVRKNIFHCMAHAYWSNTPLPTKIEVLVHSSTAYSGTASPNSEVYIYKDNTGCMTCSPVTFYRKVLADADGKWGITGDFSNDRFVANATLLQTSSEFTQPLILTSRFGYWYNKSEPTCGQANGTLELSNPVHILRVEWYNLKDEKVGEGFKVTGLPPGDYYAVGYNGKCAVKSSGAFLINQEPVFYDETLRVQQPGCGLKNGSITGMYVSGASTTRWVNEKGEQVGGGLNLNNVGPGSYSMEVTTNGTCTKQYGPIVLRNTDGPGLDRSKALIKPANCLLSDGSITGLLATGIGAISYAWKDASGAVLARTAELSNAKAGSYVLEVKDESTCGLLTEVFDVPGEHMMVLNEQSVRISNASCEGANGAVLGVTASGAKSVRWLNERDEVMGTEVNLMGVPAGKYRMLISNGSCDQQSQVYEVLGSAGPQMNMMQMRLEQDHCGLKTGAIRGIVVSGGSAPYSYEWRNQSNQLMGTGAELMNVQAGTYRLEVADANGCKVMSTEIDISMRSEIAAPVVLPVQICAAGNATIVPDQRTGGRFLLYESLGSQKALASTTSIFSVLVRQSSTYYVSYTNGICESARVPVQVEVTEHALQIANAFSPNGDGSNDSWKIDGLVNYPGFILKVFNRNGQVIYETRDPHFVFNGTVAGRELPIGLYYYVLNLREGCSTISGSLTLIR